MAPLLQCGKRQCGVSEPSSQSAWTRCLENERRVTNRFSRRFRKTEAFNDEKDFEQVIDAGLR
jgi:hypothetical protein